MRNPHIARGVGEINLQPCVVWPICHSLFLNPSLYPFWISSPARRLRYWVDLFSCALPFAGPSLYDFECVWMVGGARPLEWVMRSTHMCTSVAGRVCFGTWRLVVVDGAWALQLVVFLRFNWVCCSTALAALNPLVASWRANTPTGHGMEFDPVLLLLLRARRC